MRNLVREAFQKLCRLRYPQSAEMIVVPIMIALILAVGGPALLQQRDRVLRQQTRHQFQQISLGLSHYHDTFQSYPVNPSTKPLPVVDNSAPVVQKQPTVRKGSPTRQPTSEPELVSPL